MALFKSKYSVTKVNPKSFNLGQLPFLLNNLLATLLNT